MLTKHRSRDLQSGSHGRNVTILVSHNRKKSYDHVGSNYTVYKYYIDQIYNSNKQGTIMAQYTGEHPPRCGFMHLSSETYPKKSMVTLALKRPPARNTPGPPCPWCWRRAWGRSCSGSREIQMSSWGETSNMVQIETCLFQVYSLQNNTK